MSDRLPEPVTSTNTFPLQESFLSAHKSPVLLNLRRVWCPPWSLSRNILPHRGSVTTASSPPAAPLSSICAEELLGIPPPPSECRNHALKPEGDGNRGYSQSQSPGNLTVNHDGLNVLTGPPCTESSSSGSQSATLLSLSDAKVCRPCRERPSRQGDPVPSFDSLILQ